MSSPKSCGSTTAEPWGLLRALVSPSTKAGKDVFWFGNAKEPLLSSPLLQSTDSGARETNQIWLKGSEEQRDEENENNDQGKEKRKCRWRGDRAPPPHTSWRMRGGFPIVWTPPGSETLLAYSRVFNSIPEESFWHLPCPECLVLWEMPKKGSKKIVNSPHLANRSSKLIYEECIHIIFPTS